MDFRFSTLTDFGIKERGGAVEMIFSSALSNRNNLLFSKFVCPPTVWKFARSYWKDDILKISFDKQQNKLIPIRLCLPSLPWRPGNPVGAKHKSRCQNSWYVHLRWEHGRERKWKEENLQVVQVDQGVPSILGDRCLRTRPSHPWVRVVPKKNARRNTDLVLSHWFIHVKTSGSQLHTSDGLPRHERWFKRWRERNKKNVVHLRGFLSFRMQIAQHTLHTFFPYFTVGCVL